jgi:hypothetical protein
MATITISNLSPAGSDLFSDSESYLYELSGEEASIQGGITPAILTYSIAQTIATVVVSVGYSIVKTVAKYLDKKETEKPPQQ